MARQLIEAPHGALGFDTDWRPTAAQYLEMRAIGFAFAIRYLGDLKPDEVNDCLGAGLGLMVVQHAHLPGWTVVPDEGTADGRRAVRDALAAGLPAPMELWADVEGCAPGTTVEALNAYVKQWSAPVVAATHEACGYIGSAVPGDELALYELAFTGYWKSLSNVRTPAKRGFRLIQLYRYPKGECVVQDVFPRCSSLVAELPVDVTVAQSDYLGGRPKMLVAA